MGRREERKGKRDREEELEGIFRTLSVLKFCFLNHTITSKNPCKGMNASNTW
jgi:hypothetical protein